LSRLSVGAGPLGAAAAIGAIGGPITIVIAGGATVFGIAAGRSSRCRRWARRFWRGSSAPSCHRGKLYDGYLALAPRCDVCALDYRFADSGDGPAMFVILVTGFIVVGAALIVEILYSPPYWLHAALWGPLAIILPLVLLRSFKDVLIALQFRHKAGEGAYSD
jgi:uncharacterized protein (DUF983 family)